MGTRFIARATKDSDFAQGCKEAVLRGKEWDIHAIIESMGYKPRIDEKSTRLNEPKQEEILVLRCFDANRYFLGKLKAK